MSKEMLIDADFTGEVRVAVVDDGRIEEFEYEQRRSPTIGNIYLAKVTRVEAALEAAFVDYGAERHGFLSFSNIHPDNFRIPGGVENFVEEKLREEDSAGGDLGIDKLMLKIYQKAKQTYNISEVIKPGQLLLVQIAKEERDYKGAALTTYIALSGRYCVLMPNSIRGGGVSRKISDSKERQWMKSLIAEISLPKGMSLILRTAADGQNKEEIIRDSNYVSELWNKIRDLVQQSKAPCMVHEEGNLLKRCIRDLYKGDIDQVIVAGEAGYEACKNFMRDFASEHSDKVTLYSSQEKIPLFVRWGIEEKLKIINDNVVPLDSGGDLVINRTEALVAIDVNSGKAIRGRSVEETALNTNLEAAREITRQLRLRDLAGLVVIDFISMDNHNNNRKVEACLNKHLRADRANLDVGRIGRFGLLELARQRLRPSFLESVHERCPTCAGGGYVQTHAFAAETLIRQLQSEAYKGEEGKIIITAGSDLVLYLLNHKAFTLEELKNRYVLNSEIRIDSRLVTGFTISREAHLETPHEDSSESLSEHPKNAKKPPQRRANVAGKKNATKPFPPSHQRRNKSSGKTSPQDGHRYNQRAMHYQNNDEYLNSNMPYYTNDSTDTDIFADESPGSASEAGESKTTVIIIDDGATDVAIAYNGRKPAKSATSKVPAKKGATKKGAAKKGAAKKGAAKKGVAKKGVAKKVTGKKIAAKKATAKKLGTKPSESSKIASGMPE